MKNQPAVRVTGLTKRYGSATVVDNLDFEIEAGEIVSLLGPNGAGKSTTIEILEGYRTRDGGDVSVLGEDPQDAGRHWRSRLGIVLQSSGMPQAATVRELVAQFAGYYPRPRDVGETIEAVGLTEQAGKRVSKLSGGQQRRVDVALGIVGRPELLFLDEPTTGFDPGARREFWGLIASLREEGTAILLTTHYLDEAAELSDRGVVIAGGRKVAEGSIHELGGSGARMPVVRWTDAVGEHAERCPEPAKMVVALYESIGEPADLEVGVPSLEDVYLDILSRATTTSPIQDSEFEGSLR
ncbi:ABC transporter ATP-binding protein [Propionibacterium sp.]|uniref:ABC transporter ATP-binding protein n=1 Tax=Propionibacterium sp. TaxID=1977903 RepID=UPI0039EB6486